jgi:hypothetical protein
LSNPFLMKRLLILLFLTLPFAIFAQTSQEEFSDTCHFIQFPQVLAIHSELENGWFVNSNCGILYFEIQIFNRWGQLLHEQSSLPENKQILWDYKKAEPGTYYYILYVEFNDGSGEKKKLTTHITVL